MTQDKEILLKDLCARLPYKIYAQIPDEYGGYTSAIESIDIDGFVKDFEGAQIEIENIKPYLFPLSSMTDEQKKEMSSFDSFQTEETKTLGQWAFHLVDFYNKYHIDYRGLIEKGLAIDATRLNIY